MPTRVLIFNMAWMLTGNILNGLSQWGQLVALSKVGTVEMVGTFALATAIVVPFLMFTSLGLRSLQVTDHKRSHRFVEYLSLRMLTLGVSLISVLAFGLVAWHKAEVILSIVLIACAKAAEYISDMFYGALQQKERMSSIAISMSVRAVLSLAALTFGVYRTHSLVWGAGCMFIVSTLVLVGYDVPRSFALHGLSVKALLTESKLYLKRLGDKSGWQTLRKLGIAGLPMGFVLMLVSLNVNIPRYFIQRDLGTYELAIFSAIAMLLAPGSVVTNAAGQAAAPRLAKFFGDGDKRGFIRLLTALVGGSLGLGALGFCGALLFGKPAMALIYRPEYSAHQEVLMWLMGASGFFYLGSTLGYAVTAVRCFTPQLPLFAGAAAATALGCVALVPSLGLRGAAIAILISALVQCGGSALLLWKSCERAFKLPPCRQPTGELVVTG
jgi:O-antigen/teichoic acid export membrane protein